jgi:periplasmic protein CpxP/Spy
MNAFKTSVSALALVALAAGGIGAATLAPVNASAQTTQTAPAAPAGHRGMHHGHHRFNAEARARFLEGRIAFIKAVLKITPAQEGAFNGLADAMRANAKDRATAWEQMKANHGKPKTAIDRVENQVRAIKAREASRERVLAALKPLYETLTPDQKKVADHMVGGHGRHGNHSHRG